jgi:hypothetical protein
MWRKTKVLMSDFLVTTRFKCLNFKLEYYLSKTLKLANLILRAAVYRVYHGAL